MVDTENLKKELKGYINEDDRISITSDNSTWVVTGNSGISYTINSDGNVEAQTGDFLELSSSTYIEGFDNWNLIDGASVEK